MPFLRKGVALTWPTLLVALAGFAAPAPDLYRTVHALDSEHVLRIGLELEPGVTAQIGLEFEPGG